MDRKYERVILISRVTLGDPFYVQDQKQHQNQRRAPARTADGAGLLYDSECSTAAAAAAAAVSVCARPFDWLAGLLAGWLAGWLAGSLARLQPHSRLRCVCTGVIANRGATTSYGNNYHYEYIVYDRNQAYPEYIVHLQDSS